MATRRARSWVLIDTGLSTSSDRIREFAALRFGDNVSPAAIVMTRAHFDHAGSVESLASYWDVPLFAHPLEKAVSGGRGRPILPPIRWPAAAPFWRESDRTLIAGDAIITTGQESAYEAIAQTPEMHGPPRYFTPDWQKAEKSVSLLASLEPALIISGHGRPLKGQNVRNQLHHLAAASRDIAVPQGGRYDRDPAKPGKSGNDAFR
ncbi:MBL fold metallo-hydrolase [Rhizobium lentis]|uniref:MBL fold metallo-hydrolase n=1 Tax=Rhizobium lentis TaxID=1138194 RepID=UPI002180C351|nr:MBL fold metallo-hydrolase [Rhizobium lentis]